MTPEKVTEKQKGLLPWELQIRVVQFPIEHELLQEHSLAYCSHTGLLESFITKRKCC
jgi:hypothetical protein